MLVLGQEMKRIVERFTMFYEPAGRLQHREIALHWRRLILGFYGLMNEWFEGIMYTYIGSIDFRTGQWKRMNSILYYISSYFVSLEV
jgi:hypothetical protein